MARQVTLVLPKASLARPGSIPATKTKDSDPSAIHATRLSYSDTSRYESIESPVEVGTLLGSVYFGFDSDDTDNSTKAYEALQRVAALSHDDPRIAGIQLNGYTDPIGNNQYNLDLSARRCRSVKASLKRFGLDIPISVNANGECKRCTGKYNLYRRVDVVVSKTAAKQPPAKKTVPLSVFPTFSDARKKELMARTTTVITTLSELSPIPHLYPSLPIPSSLLDDLITTSRIGKQGITPQTTTPVVAEQLPASGKPANKTKQPQPSRQHTTALTEDKVTTASLQELGRKRARFKKELSALQATRTENEISLKSIDPNRTYKREAKQKREWRRYITAYTNYWTSHIAVLKKQLELTQIGKRYTLAKAMYDDAAIPNTSGFEQKVDLWNQKIAEATTKRDKPPTQREASETLRISAATVGNQKPEKEVPETVAKEVPPAAVKTERTEPAAAAAAVEPTVTGQDDLEEIIEEEEEKDTPPPLLEETKHAPTPTTNQQTAKTVPTTSISQITDYKVVREMTTTARKELDNLRRTLTKKDTRLRTTKPTKKSYPKRKREFLTAQLSVFKKELEIAELSKQTKILMNGSPDASPNVSVENNNILYWVEKIEQVNQEIDSLPPQD